MADRGAGRNGRDDRRGFGASLALSVALGFTGGPSAAYADELEDALAIVDLRVAALDRGESFSAADSVTFIKSVLVVQSLGRATRPPPERILELLTHATQVAHARADVPDSEALLTALRVRELTALGRAAEALDEIDGRLDALVDAARYCGPQLALEAYQACADCGRYEQAARLLDVADSRTQNAAAYSLRDTAFIVAEKRLLAAQEVGTPDRAAHWLARMQQRLADLGEHAGPARRTAVRKHAILVALASGSQRAALDACEAALAPGPDGPHGRRYVAFVRLRQALASRIDGDDPRRLPAAAIRAELERASHDSDLDAQDQTLAASRLATMAVRAGELDEAQRIIDAMRDAAATSDVRLALVTLAAGVALERRAPADTLRDLTLDLEHRLLARFDAYARLPTMTDGVGPLYYESTREALGVWITAHRSMGGADADADAVAMIVRGQASGTLARSLGATTPTLADVRDRVLGPGEGLLLYVFAPTCSHVFAIDHEGVEHADVAPSRALLAARNDLLEAITTRPDMDADGNAAAPAVARARARGQAFGGLLVPARLAGRVRAWSGVAFCGIDAFGTMPCEAAIVGETWIGTSTAVRILPSIPVAWFLANTPTLARPGARAFVVAARTPALALRELDGRIARLPVNDARIRAWLDPFDRGSVLLQDAQATPTALRDHDAHAAALTLILAHGFARVDAERPAALALAPQQDGDGLFTCDDAEATRSAEVVFLATCSAARGPRRAGDDGAQHLGGAFVRAGARTVVLALGPTDLDATLLLVDAFAARFGAGASAANAMREARARVAADARFAHPYSFAQFQVFGR